MFKSQCNRAPLLHIRQAETTSFNLILVKVFVAQQFHFLCERLLFEIALVALYLCDENFRAIIEQRYNINFVLVVIVRMAPTAFPP